MRFRVAPFAWAGPLLVLGSMTAAADCGSMAGLALPNTTITAAQSVPAGTFTAPDGEVFANLPAFCRVAGAIKPTSDSNILFEVWMPSSGWNQKFKGNGNGGYAGSIIYSAMASDVRLGYASTSTDTGHEASVIDGSWALGHPEKIIDFGYRAHHLVAQDAKSIVEAFYSAAPRHSYFQGCSGGGQEAQMESQRFPDDYDGIIAGDPANFWTHHYVGAHLWISRATLGDPSLDSYVSASQAAVIGNAVNAACDAQDDGIVDGVLVDPRDCHFQPARLLCKAGQDPGTCLTAPQVEAVAKIWAGPDRATSPGFYPGLAQGGETLGWPGFVTGPAPFFSVHYLLGIPFFKYFVYNDPNWDFRTFDFKTDPAFVDAKMGPIMNATSPDLSAFRRHGGKLIHYHGYSDPDISPINSINYFESVVAGQAEEHGPREALEETQEFYRLFLAPGMNHCAGGPGPNVFDTLTALDEWVDDGIAPEKIIATKYVNDNPAQGVVMTRPLCPYPEQARYKGTGSTNDAANFVCANDRDRRR